MSTHRRKRHPEMVPTRPAPEDRTVQFPAVTLLKDKEAVTETFPRPAIEMVPAPVQGPATVPPLRPVPAPHPRGAWVPATAPASRPPAPIPITASAVLARDDKRFAAICSVRCQRQGCTRSTSQGGTRSFADLYAAAEADGWRKDYWDAWMCPQCQQKPGYWPASVPAPRTTWAELALTWDAKGAAGDDDFQIREAIRYLQTPPDASALEAVKSE